MKRRKRSARAPFVVTVALATSAGACGGKALSSGENQGSGGTTPATGGTGGVEVGTGGTAAVGGTVGIGCPTHEPSDGTPCAKEGQSCFYADVCGAEVQCLDGAWRSVPISCNPPPPPIECDEAVACPDTPPTQDEWCGECPPTPASCFWDDCEAGVSITGTCGSANTWELQMLDLECNPPPPPMPAVVACGGGLCDAGESCHVCTDAPTGTTLQQCVAPGETGPPCSLKLIASCDDNGDCSPGEQCFEHEGDVTVFTGCGDASQACNSRGCQRFCDSDSDCPDAGWACEVTMLTSFAGGEYGPVQVCTLPD